MEYLRLFCPTVGLAQSLTSELNLHRSFNFPEGKSMLLFYKQIKRPPQISWAEPRFPPLPCAEAKFIPLSRFFTSAGPWVPENSHLPAFLSALGQPSWPSISALPWGSSGGLHCQVHHLPCIFPNQPLTWLPSLVSCHCHDSNRSNWEA